MHKVLGVLVTLFAVATTMLLPVSVHAQTITSSEQQVIIHASVAASRIIVVNDKGQMTKIYSNTKENVLPQVHAGSPIGPEQALTPELLDQYNQVLATHHELQGVEIPVAIPRPVPQGIAKLLHSKQEPASGTKFIAQLSPPFFTKS